MYRNKKILAVIPARGGSKGLPRKNIKEMLGTPLIGWTIKQAKNSKYVDSVVVSTDDKEIAAIARQLGGSVPFLRPSELAKDSTPTYDVLADLVKKSTEEYDILVLLEPTSPLRKKDDIDTALKQLIDNYEKYDSVVSVGKVHMENPHICKLIEKNKVVPLIKTNKNITQRQELKDVYFPYGVIYASKLKKLMATQSFYQKKTMPYFIERWQNYEIDDIYDFICIESIMKEKLKKTSFK